MPKTPILLNEQCIRDALKALGHSYPITLHLYERIDSTNRVLNDLSASQASDGHEPIVCLAEAQTAGRGRLARSWYSPYGENLYFSYLWSYKGPLGALSGLSLVVALALLATLKQLGVQEPVYIKWPNDLLWQEKKLAGILIELKHVREAHAEVIIGIGLNANAKLTAASPIDKPWCSLHQMTGETYDRNPIVAHLICQLHDHLARFQERSFAPFRTAWEAADYLAGKTVDIATAQGTLSGKACGITPMGQLKVQDREGFIHLIASGEASVRRY